LDLKDDWEVRVPLPLLLAGPILRRVEPTLVSVWVALRDPATVTLSLWDGHVSPTASSVLISSEAPGVKTLRVGEQLHIAVALIKIAKNSPKVLRPGKIYSYDVTIKTEKSTETLGSLGLLKQGEIEGKRVEPLGYEDGKLPSFALPPQELTDLRVVFGSCRRPTNSHLDAMVYIDDIMRGESYHYSKPLQRPHQLFLGGDQIYADDVSPLHLAYLIELGKELIGSDRKGTVRERVMVDHIRKARKPGPPRQLEDYGADVVRVDGENNDDLLLPADADHFPPGRRYQLTTVEAQMTTTDGTSHLFSLGEFAAMYLSVWSNTVWLPFGPRDADDKRNTLPADKSIIVPRWPEIIPTYIDAPLDESLSLHKSLEEQRRQLQEFENGLPFVRRVLANIPTYMIFDDHDVTDDWNLNPVWCDRVNTTSLGVTALRNALVSYALFQDLGNDPLRYEKVGSKPKQLMEQIEGMFPGRETPGPDAAATKTIDILFGFDLRHKKNVDGGFAEISPPMKWHYSVPGPKHLTVVLDNRTRRSFVSENGPPGNVSAKAIPEQIPAGPFGDGKEVLLVVAPLQVIGPPIFDELIAPASYRAFDMASLGIKKQEQADLESGRRGMAGTDPDAIEAWCFDPMTFEALLERLEPYRQVVLLSGDVHHSASEAMSYFKKGQKIPARIASFTSSGFKNVMPPYLAMVNRSFAFAQTLIRSGVGAARLGWKAKPSKPILLPSGKNERDIPRALRAKLRQSPVMIPTYGWPEGSMINPDQRPDWSWHVQPVLDQRPDEKRPIAARPPPIDEMMVVDHLGRDRSVEGFHALAARHQGVMSKLRNSRQILFRSNFSLLRFERRGPDNALYAIHEVYSGFKDPSESGSERPSAEAFMVHEVALAVKDGVPPEVNLQAPKSKQKAST
jgi:hypothetical protein